MRISTSMRATAIALVGLALVSAAPAMGADDRTQAAPAASPAGGDDGGVIIRRAGPLNRIDSTPVRLVPDLRPSSSASGRDGFDWGDAVIGAGAAFGVLLLASGAIALTRRRGHHETQPTVPA
jgi:hypothetical protein